eukprot:14635936-Heterocapsa_arctica.AAC.1
MVHEPSRQLRVALTCPLEEHPGLLCVRGCHCRHDTGSLCKSNRQEKQVPTLDEIIPHDLLLDVGAMSCKARFRAV